MASAGARQPFRRAAGVRLPRRARIGRSALVPDSNWPKIGRGRAFSHFDTNESLDRYATTMRRIPLYQWRYLRRGTPATNYLSTAWTHSPVAWARWEAATLCAVAKPVLCKRFDVWFLAAIRKTYTLEHSMTRARRANSEGFSVWAERRRPELLTLKLARYKTGPKAMKEQKRTQPLNSTPQHRPRFRPETPQAVARSPSHAAHCIDACAPMRVTHAS
jgi:hypothetical protein